MNAYRRREGSGVSLVRGAAGFGIGAIVVAVVVGALTITGGVTGAHLSDLAFVAPVALGFWLNGAIGSTFLGGGNKAFGFALRSSIPALVRPIVVIAPQRMDGHELPPCVSANYAVAFAIPFALAGLAGTASLGFGARVIATGVVGFAIGGACAGIAFIALVFREVESFRTYRQRPHSSTRWGRRDRCGREEAPAARKIREEAASFLDTKRPKGVIDTESELEAIKRDERNRSQTA